MTDPFGNLVNRTLWYRHWRSLLAVFVLGISSGFPWVMISSAMMVWLKSAGYSRTDIGFYGLVFLAFSINFLWSPLLDRLRLPWARWLGGRRSWILFMQAIIAGACLMMANAHPEEGLEAVKYLAFAIAAAGATQDIAIDAYRIQLVEAGDDRHMALLSAMATAGWWTGFSGLGAVPFLLVNTLPGGWATQYSLMGFAMLGLLLITCFLEKEKAAPPVASVDAAYLERARKIGPARLYGAALLFAAGFSGLVWLALGMPGTTTTPARAALTFVLVGVVFAISARLLFNAEAGNDTVDGRPAPGWPEIWVSRMLATFVEPVRDFFSRNGVRLASAILLFIFLFKIGEAFLGRMSIIFYKDVGFTEEQIGLYSKLISWWVTIVFSLLGGWVSARFGLMRGLFAGGIAMSASNLMFAWLALAGPDVHLLAAAVVVDGFTSAWSTVAFVGFLSILCSKTFSAAQYAALASLGTLGRTFLASYSGWVVDLLGGNWPLFFVLTSVMVAPSLILLAFIRRALNRHLASLRDATETV